MFTINFFAIFLFLVSVSGRGTRSEKEQLYLGDDFKGEAKAQELDHPFLVRLDKPSEPLRSNGNPVPAISEVGKPSGGTVEEGGNVPTSHQMVDQENVGSDKRKKVGSGWNYQAANLTVEYVPSLENETWSAEKKKKIEVGKVNQASPCEVTTGELIATAQATVTKALKGLCNANDMEERFDGLENSLAKQLSTIRNMILNLEKRLEEHEDAIIYGQKQLSAAMSKNCLGNGSGRSHTPNMDLNKKSSKSAYDYGKGGLGTTEDVPEEDVSGVRDSEILKFNSSIHMETSLSGPPKKVFTYYWKIHGMTYKLTGWNPRKSIRSQSFYIFPSGYRMYMRVFPRQNEDSFYVRVGLTKGEFDESLSWPFPLKHKIHILDQTKEGRLFEDVASRIWDPTQLCSDFNWQKPIVGDNHECVEVAFPHDILGQREYIRKDSLVIKLTVYLES